MKQSKGGSREDTDSRHCFKEDTKYRLDKP